MTRARLPDGAYAEGPVLTAKAYRKKQKAAADHDEDDGGCAASRRALRTSRSGRCV